MTYRSAGVDIESADALVNQIKCLTKKTIRSGVCGGIGGFGGIFDLKEAGFVDPYLVSRGAGIGEKLMVRDNWICYSVTKSFTLKIKLERSNKWKNLVYMWNVLKFKVFYVYINLNWEYMYRVHIINKHPISHISY